MKKGSPEDMALELIKWILILFIAGVLGYGLFKLFFGVGW